jgi:hypothetical protein
MTDQIELQTVPVHVTNARDLAPAPAAAPADTEVNCRTFTLKTGQTTGNDSVIARILDRDPARTQAVIMLASGTAVYLCHSSAQAEAAAADSTAIGGAQDGFILTSVAPLPPLRTTDPVWAVVPADKAAAGAQVAVIAERRRA